MDELQTREYKLGKGWAWLIYLTAPCMLALFGWLLIQPILPLVQVSIPSAAIPLDAYWFITPIALAMIIVLLIGLRDAYKGKVVINPNKIAVVSTFSNRELYTDEIKGYRITDKYLFIEPIDSEKKRVKISTYYSGCDEIEMWLSERFTDLDIEDALAEKNEVLEAGSFGWSEEEQAHKLAQAHKTAKFLNWTGGIIGGWILFYPRPYEAAIWLSAIFPLICLGCIKTHRGLLRLDEQKSSVFPNVFWAVFAPGMGICLRGLFDYTIIDYSALWLPLAFSVIAFMGILAFRSTEFTFKKVNDYVKFFSVALVITGYFYGLILSLNGAYDNSVAEVYKATVLSKHSSSGKTTSYYLELSPWGPQTESEDFSVSLSKYEQIHEHDVVNVYLMKGRFNIPWVEIEP